MLVAVVCALSACKHSERTVIECPSCNPPIRYYEVVTECSEFTEKELEDGSYTQCRYCTNRIYSNGIDVTDQFTHNNRVPETTTYEKYENRKVKGLKKRPCGKKNCSCGK